MVFDSYATGNHRQAEVSVVNQTPEPRKDLRVRVRIYDLNGKQREDRTAAVNAAAGGSRAGDDAPGRSADSPVFFVRCQLIDKDGAVLAENVYWQSQIPDDVGPPDNDVAFDSRQVSWADMTP